MHTQGRGLALALVAGIALAAPAAAQNQVAVEFRAGFPRPMGDFRDPPGLEAEGDVDLGADVIFNVSDRLSLYGGWGRDGFSCAGCEGGDYVRSQGFEGGAKVLFGRDAGALPWVRVGALLHELKVRTGSLETSSDRALGLQAGAGVDIPLGEVLSFTPALRFHTYKADFPVVGDVLISRETVSYLALDFGLHVHVGR